MGDSTACGNRCLVFVCIWLVGLGCCWYYVCGCAVVVVMEGGCCGVFEGCLWLCCCGGREGAVVVYMRGVCGCVVVVVVETGYCGVSEGCWYTCEVCGVQEVSSGIIEVVGFVILVSFFLRFDRVLDSVVGLWCCCVGL